MIAVALVVLLGVPIGIAHWRKGDSAPDTAWFRIAKLRGTLVRELPAGGGGGPAVLSGGPHGHVLYVVTQGCAVCDIQRSHLATLLAELPQQSVITVTPQSGAVANDYWRALEAPLPDPVMVDSTWWRASGLSPAPLLVFLSKSGHVASAVGGSIMSWGPQTMINELRRAELVD